MDDRFYNAFLPPSVRVCGRVLKRFTVWHHFILSAIDSPITGERESLRPGDLLVAIRSCGLSYGGTRNISPNLRDIYWRWRMNRDPRLFKREAKKFFDWMGVQCSAPVFWRKSTGSREMVEDKSPGCFALVCSLMQRGGVGMEIAWNLPIGEARWTDVQLAKASGIDIRYMDDEDLDDSEIDFSGLSDAEALEIYRRDMPNEKMAQASFEHWRHNIKNKEKFDGA